MSSQASFQFGVEIELLLGGRKKAYSSWMSLAKDVSKKLAQAGISNHINEGNSKSRDNYREWSIVQEVTIPNQPAKNLCPWTTSFPPPPSRPSPGSCYSTEGYGVDGTDTPFLL